MPVYNIKNIKNLSKFLEDKDNVYIGREMFYKGIKLQGSPLANPYKIGADGTRDQVINKYKKWLSTNQHLLSDIAKLDGKNLVCWCYPKKCHVDVLIGLLKQAKNEN